MHHDPEFLLHDARINFDFAKECARSAGIPDTGGWALTYDAGMPLPWRIIDTTMPGPGSRTVFTLNTSDPSRELESIGQAFHAIHELKSKGKTMNFTCAARLRERDLADRSDTNQFAASQPIDVTSHPTAEDGRNA